mmetsp:Transcript_24892/g.80522  ORF Transcript_24892/g.80522 Transcript_24892/m.80522 type:complete len:217 (+) Transcript_24892:1275-1925(+)
MARDQDRPNLVLRHGTFLLLGLVLLSRVVGGGGLVVVFVPLEEKRRRLRLRTPRRRRAPAVLRRRGFNLLEEADARREAHEGRVRTHVARQDVVRRPRSGVVFTVVRGFRRLSRREAPQRRRGDELEGDVRRVGVEQLHQSVDDLVLGAVDEERDLGQLRRGLAEPVVRRLRRDVGRRRRRRVQGRRVQGQGRDAGAAPGSGVLSRHDGLDGAAAA